MKKILVLMELNEELRRLLESAAPDCDFTYAADDRATDEMFEDAEIILGTGGTVPRGLKACRKLKYIATRAAGFDQYLVPGVLPEDVVLTNAAGVYSKPVAEHALALTLSLQKNLPFYRDNQNSAIWRSEGSTSSLEDGTVLVVGLGEIGKYYARLVKALGAYVIGVKRTEDARPDFVDEQYTREKLGKVVGRADIVFNSLPATSDTYHLYDAEMFSRMKRTAIFINCGRGSTVDTDAMCDALENEVIRSAACDVFEVEPLPAESRAWKVRNLLITPHRAGYLLLPGTDKALVKLLAENLRAWQKGEKLKNVVDQATYSRAQ